MKFGDNDVSALNEDLAEFGLENKLELTQDKLDRGYLCGIAVLFYIRSLASKDLVAANNLSQVLESLLADVTSEAKYVNEIKFFEGERQKAIKELNENMGTLERSDEMRRITAWFTQSKFTALVRLMARSGVYGKQLGGMAFTEKKAEKGEKNGAVV